LRILHWRRIVFADLVEEVIDGTDICTVRPDQGDDTSDE
jgi:hypothetical protein